MAQSFVPQGMTTICTEMTSGVPMKLGLSRSSMMVIHTGESSPLLNIDDRKLSGTFLCKIPVKFFGGLQMLTAVIAIGALAIATVATGGAALVVAGVGLLAAGVSIGSGITALYKTVHDCDCTLQSQWMLFHDTANIEGKPAILQLSFLKCNKGGIISIIPNPAVAASAAKKISQNNDNEACLHMFSQAVQGVITVATGFNPAAIVVAFPLSVWFYVSGENEKQDTRAYNTEAYFLNQEIRVDGWGNQVSDFVQNESITAIANLPGELITNAGTITATNRALMAEQMEFGAMAVAREATGDIVGANSARLAQDIAERSVQGLKELGKSTAKGLLKGLAWGLVNATIDYLSDVHEDNLFEDSINTALVARRESNNKLNVLAQTK